MVDRLGRVIDYMRVSVTERCNLACKYCRAASDDDCERRELSKTDIIRCAAAFAALGGKKLRFTGGEPLLRKDIEDIIGGVSALRRYDDIALTTNAHGLKDRLRGLITSGLNRVNISLDSLNPVKYRALTGGSLDEAMRGVNHALELGISLKVNVVLTPDNINEADDFIALARENPIEVRFIELMPFGPYGSGHMGRVTNQDIIRQRPWLNPVRQPGKTADICVIEGYKGTVGFISPVSRRFCGGCNRVRLTADGKLLPCLGDAAEFSLLEALERGDEALKEAMREAIYIKPSGHCFGGGFEPERAMNRIGG
ncbi:MAG: GTP 3',8-cyclase MoaA [Clostridiales bacterium]|jgi:cyclic pyranopterin phosphate synthase|nr:GTP 3',8-cyclase MoaA [Clostridiales bacterium]